MAKKWIVLISLICLCLALFSCILIGELKPLPVIASIASLFLGASLSHTKNALQDCTDYFPWQVSLRKLLRGKVIHKNDPIRISFAYLYRIKVDDKYFLVKNARGTGKFQPVGGAFKMQPTEKSYISSVFHVTDDNKIKYDQTSKNDYRLFVPVKYLKKFISRFDQAKDREQISNLTREFSEEVISNGILKFNHIEYRYCGRHFTEISYSRVFNCYELLLADIVELKLTAEQESQLRALMSIESDKYYFATADEIKSCGVIGGTNKLSEFIADHATKILQENELNLIPSNSPNTISIDL